MCASSRVFSLNFVPLAVFQRDNSNCSAGLAQWRGLAQTLILVEYPLGGLAISAFGGSKAVVDFSFLLSRRGSIILCFLSADVKFACSVQASSFRITRVSKLLGVVMKTEFIQC